MTLTWAIRSFEILLGWSLLLQTLEYLRLPSRDKLTLWPILSQEIPAHPAWLKATLNHLFQPMPYRAWLYLRGVLAMGLMLGHVGLEGAVLLFVMALLLLLRWRGAFNGGSDFMTLIVLTGMLIAQCMAQAGLLVQQLALVRQVQGGDQCSMFDCAGVQLFETIGRAVQPHHTDQFTLQADRAP